MYKAIKSVTNLNKNNHQKAEVYQWTLRISVAGYGTQCLDVTLADHTYCHTKHSLIFIAVNSQTFIRARLYSAEIHAHLAAHCRCLHHCRTIHPYPPCFCSESKH